VYKHKTVAHCSFKWLVADIFSVPLVTSYDTGSILLSYHTHSVISRAVAGPLLRNSPTESWSWNCCGSSLS